MAGILFSRTVDLQWATFAVTYHPAKVPTENSGRIDSGGVLGPPGK